MPVSKLPPSGVLPASGTSSPVAPPVRFEAIRSARAFEDIAAQIRMEMTERRLQVGDKLPSERVLAEQFGVSRNTLREALRSLEHAGLIELRKGASGGAFIREGRGEAVTTGLMDMYQLGAVQPAQLTQARIWLEAIVVREACARAKAADIAELQANIQAVGEASKLGDFQARAALNLGFHRILARMTGNPIIVVFVEGLLEMLAHFIGTIGAYENAFILPSRRRFMKHFEAGDADAAVAEMQASLQRLQKNYLSVVEAGGKAGPGTVKSA